MTAFPRSAVARRLVGFIAVLGAAGCLSKAPLATQSYSIDPPSQRAMEVLPGAVTVSVYSVRVAAPYGGTSFTYRTGDHRIERDPYALFAAPPGWMLTVAIKDYLRQSGFVRDVVEPGDGISAVAVIEPDVGELYAEFDSPGGAAGILAIRFRVLGPLAEAAPRKELLLKTYRARVPMPQQTAQAAAVAWNTALATIMDEFLPDLKASLAAH